MRLQVRDPESNGNRRQVTECPCPLDTSLEFLLPLSQLPCQLSAVWWMMVGIDSLLSSISVN